MDTESERELCAQLGSVVVRFNRLEWALRRLVASLTPMLDVESELWFAQLSFQGHVNVASGLLRRAHSGPKESAVEAFVKRLGEAEVRRNRALHSMWAFNIETTAPVRAKSRARSGKLVEPDYDRDPLPELVSLNEELRLLVGEVLRIVTEGLP
jgi:hypothetical protein